MNRVIFDSKALEDGYLDNNSGRIVIYDGVGMASRGNSMDHNDLLRALARQYGFHTQKVISNAIRLYYTRYRGHIIVTERRKIDYDTMERNLDYYASIIEDAVKR